MNLLKIMCFCIIGTTAFSMDVDTLPEDKSPNLSQQESTDVASQHKDSTFDHIQKFCVGKLNPTIQKMLEKLTTARAQSELIDKSFNALQTLSAPALINVNKFIQQTNLDQAAFGFGGIVLGYKYVNGNLCYTTILLSTALCAESNLTPLCDTLIPFKEKSFSDSLSFLSNRELSATSRKIMGCTIEAKEVFAVAGMLAIICQVDIQSATLFSLALYASFQTHESNPNASYLGSVLAYMFLLESMGHIVGL